MMWKQTLTRIIFPIFPATFNLSYREYSLAMSRRMVSGESTPWCRRIPSGGTQISDLGWIRIFDTSSVSKAIRG